MIVGTRVNFSGSVGRIVEITALGASASVDEIGTRFNRLHSFTHLLLSSASNVTVVPTVTGSLVNFDVAGNTAFIHRPVSASAGNPWIMFSPTLLPSLPNTPVKSFYFSQSLSVGIAVAGVDVGESYGSPSGVAVYTRLYDAMVAAGFSTTPLLFCQSRGGLMAYNWASENASKVCAIAGIYPVGDLASYPGINNTDVWARWGFLTSSAVTAALPQISPINRLASLASASVKIYHLHGDSDVVVPIEENSQLIKDRYDAMSGSMTLVIIPGKGHENSTDPDFFQNQALADFINVNAE